MMQSETIRQRASILGVQIISKATATRLGIVTQIWLDVDQRKVMGLSIAEKFIPGTPIGIGDTFYMSLDRISLFGPDAILVDDESVLEDILVTEKYTNLIGNEVVTESGELLGKVRDFKFDPDTGDLVYLILAALGNPFIPTAVISTYELDVNEIIAVGRDRIIVTEGMEDRMTQLSKGLLERLGLGKPPWEDEFEDEYNMPPATFNNLRDNALSSGKRSNNSYPEQRPEQRPLYRREEAWEEEDNWSEERLPVSPPPRRQARPEPRSESRPDPKPVRPIAPPPVDDDYDDYDDFEDGYPKAKGYREETRQQIKDAWGNDVKKQPIPEEEYDEL